MKDTVVMGIVGAIVIMVIVIVVSISAIVMLNFLGDRNEIRKIVAAQALQQSP